MNQNQSNSTLKKAPHDPITLGLFSLGCTKNLVDSEVLLGDLLTSGQFALSPPEEAEVMIVNTCGFIDKAKDESVSAIVQAGEYKKTGRCQTLMVIGCLAERYKDQLKRDYPEIDYVVPLHNYQLIPPTLESAALHGRRKSKAPQVRTKQQVFPEVARFRLTPRHYGYLRVSEGCNHTCSFCVIPKIRGKHRSKPIEYLLEEARELAADGAKEINLIADDTTFYGIDLYGEPRLVELFEGLNEVDGLEWIRMFYAYPTTVNNDMVRAMAELDKIVPYLDMPIQHISDPILKAMKRPKGQRIRDVIANFREQIPGITLRTTVIVGFPGETEQHFQELVDFIRETKFKHLGVFTFSQEEGAPSAHYDNQVPDEVKEERFQTLIDVQKEIVLELNRAREGQVERVLVEEYTDGYYLARSASDGPDIDNLVLIQAEEGEMELGTFEEVELVEAREYDLIARRLPTTATS